MSISTTCPACGHQQASPGSVSGPITCGGCGQFYEVSSSAPTSRSSATKPAITAPAPAASGVTASPGPRPAAAGRPTPRPPGAPPELLDRLPKPFITSPPMIAVGAVFVLLYGMVAFGVVTTLNKRPEPQYVVTHGRPSDVAPIGPEAQKPAESPPAAADTKPRPPDQDKGKPGEAKDAATRPKDEKSKDEKSREVPGDVQAAKVVPAGPEATKPPAPAMPPSNQIARVVTPQPALVPRVERPKTESWLNLTGPPGDCKFQTDPGGVLTVSVPGSLHVISPELKLYTSPRLLTDAGGNFTAVVKVIGRISPGTVPLDFPFPPGEKPKDMPEVPKFPFTFQGAGLLVWQDENNFVKLERAARFDGSKRVPIVLLEQYQNGQAVNGKMIPAKDQETAPPPGKDRDIDLSLKIVRQGAELRCQYSPDDGKTWLDVKRLQTPKMPAAVKVGVSVSNVAAKTFEPRLQGFELTK